ncbi:hypothetical protein PCE1_001840 [Barthelona sp. PCE]
MGRNFNKGGERRTNHRVKGAGAAVLHKSRDFQSRTAKKKANSLEDIVLLADIPFAQSIEALSSSNLKDKTKHFIDIDDILLKNRLEHPNSFLFTTILQLSEQEINEKCLELIYHALFLLPLQRGEAIELFNMLKDRTEGYAVLSCFMIMMQFSVIPEVMEFYLDSYMDIIYAQLDAQKEDLYLYLFAFILFIVIRPDFELINDIMNLHYDMTSRDSPLELLAFRFMCFTLDHYLQNSKNLSSDVERNVEYYRNFLQDEIYPIQYSANVVKNIEREGDYSTFRIHCMTLPCNRIDFKFLLYSMHGQNLEAQGLRAFVVKALFSVFGKRIYSYVVYESRPLKDLLGIHFVTPRPVPRHELMKEDRESQLEDLLEDKKERLLSRKKARMDSHTDFTFFDE